APQSVPLELKAPRGPTVGYGPIGTIYLTGIDAREGFRAQPVQGAERPQSPDAGRRDTRAATPAARTEGIPARLYDRAGRADDAQGLPCAIRSYRGAGIVISQRGEVLTNWHVIDGAKDIAILTKPPVGQRLSPG